jgi:repressor LexA
MEEISKHMVVFQKLKEFININGFPPTVRELQKICGYRSTSTVHQHLSVLEGKGYIIRSKASPRAIKIRQGK